MPDRGAKNRERSIGGKVAGTRHTDIERMDRGWSLGESKITDADCRMQDPAQIWLRMTREAYPAHCIFLPRQAMKGPGIRLPGTRKASWTGQTAS